MTGVDSTTGRAIAKPRELKFMSGYEVANELKNYFKAYYQFKANQSGAIASRNARLVFKNFKDGEFLIIEIITATFDRAAERSFIYDYKIEAKVIAQFKFESPDLGFFESLDQTINGYVAKIDAARGILLGGQEVLRQIESSYDSTILEPMRKIGLAAKALAGLQITAADMGNKITKNTLTATDSLAILTVIKDQKKLAETGQSADVPESITNQELPNDLEAATSNDGAQTIVALNATLYDLPLEQMPAKTQDAMDGEIASVSEAS